MCRKLFRPSFESLETRLNPGVCNVQFFSSVGLLFIQGSNLADSVTVSQPSAGRITLTAGPGTTLKIGTTIYSTVTLGSAVTPVRSINAVMGPGNDSFVFNQTQNINLSGSVTVDLGAGTDSLSERGANTLNLAGSLLVNHLTGDANVTLTNINIMGSASITLGAGLTENLFFNVTPGHANNVIRGQLNINSSGGDKNIWIDTTDVTGATIIYGGHNATGSTSNTTLYVNEINDGVAAVNLTGGLVYSESPTTTGSDFIAIFDNTTIGNTVRLTVYGPAAYIAFAGARVNGATTINATGGGENIIALSAYYHPAVFSGVVIINTGAGTDSIALDVAGGNMSLAGGIVASLGAGDDTVSISGSGGVITGPGGTFDGGAGSDIWYCDPLHHTGLYIFNNFETPAPPDIA